MKLLNVKTGYKPPATFFSGMQENAHNDLQKIARLFGSGIVYGLIPERTAVDGSVDISTGFGWDSQGRMINVEEAFTLDFSGITRPSSGMYKKVAVIGAYSQVEDGEIQDEVGNSYWKEKSESISISFVEGDEAASESEAGYAEIDEDAFLLVDAVFDYDTPGCLSIDLTRRPVPFFKQLDEHADLTTAHGAVSAATASRMVVRDGNGRAQFADPDADADAGTKKYIDVLIKECTVYKKDIGEYFWNAKYKELSAFDISDPKSFFGGICLNTISGYKDISETNHPDLVPFLRAEALSYKTGRTGAVSEFEITAWEIASNVATLTFADNNAENAILAALAEDNLVHDSYSGWRPISFSSVIGDIAAGDYAISDIDPSTRTISFAYAGDDNSGTGSYTVAFYPYRIPGSTTTARLFECSDRTLISEASDGSAISGLRHRDFFQGHEHQLGMTSDDGDGGWFDRAESTVIKYYDTDGIITDGSNGTPRVGDKTKPKALGGFFYIHGGRYLAST